MMRRNATKPYSLWKWLLLAGLVTGCAANATSATPEPSRGVSSADAFVDAIGVDSHFNYRDTPYVLDWPTFRDVLIDSGIRNIRDGGTPESDYVARLAELGAHGIRHGASFTIENTPVVVRRRLAAFAPYVDNIEPPNEYDSQQDNDPEWAAHLVAFQKMLYSTVRSDPANASIRVLGPPLEHQKLYADLGPLDDYEDAGNLHIATCDLNPGTDSAHRGSIPYMQSLVRASTLHKPIWTTETGYNDDMKRPCALADDVIAKYDPRVVAERWNWGEDRIYFYQYADMPSDAIFGGMGLIRADGTPKPQFVALRSMIHLLADPGAAFKPKPLVYEIEGGGSDVHSTLLEKRNGTYYLLVWLEDRDWDPLFRRELTVAPRTVTVSLPKSISRVSVFSYAPDWTLAKRPVLADTGTLQLSVTDAISFLEFRPGP
jgi:hypothetical protein